MKSMDALRVLAEVTARQWGMVTSAQAKVHGVTRLDLSRLTEAGHFIRLAHGVYKDAGAPSDQFEDLHAAWLSTEPEVMGEARIQKRANGIVVGSTSAAYLHDTGDLWADRHEFVSPKRRQSQRAEIRYRQRSLDARDVTLAEGLPTMTVERTIADLVEEVGDLSLVADALRDAAFKRNLDLDRLRELLAPLAERYGLKRRDGKGLLNRLLEIARIDTDTVARQVAADSALGSRVAADYLSSLSKADLDRLIMTPEMQKSMRAIQDSVAEMLEGTLVSQLTGLQTSTDASSVSLMRSGAFDSIAQNLTAQFATSETLQGLSQGWGKSLTANLALKPETLTAIRSVQKASPDDRA